MIGKDKQTNRRKLHQNWPGSWEFNMNSQVICSLILNFFFFSNLLNAIQSANFSSFRVHEAMRLSRWVRSYLFHGSLTETALPWRNIATIRFLRLAVQHSGTAKFFTRFDWLNRLLFMRHELHSATVSWSLDLKTRYVNWKITRWRQPISTFCAVAYSVLKTIFISILFVVTNYAYQLDLSNVTVTSFIPCIFGLKKHSLNRFWSTESQIGVFLDFG